MNFIDKIGNKISRLADSVFAIFVLGGILLFIIIGIFLVIGNYNKTWTRDDGKTKIIYDNYSQCFKQNLGIGTTDVCDDEEKVIYKDK